MNDTERLAEVREKLAITQHDDEILWAMREIRFFLRSQNCSIKTVLEYGVDGGGNLALMANLIDSDGLMIGVDLAITEGRSAAIEAVAQRKVCLLNRSSIDPETTKLIATMVPGGIDVCFFDSLHTEEQLDNELEQALTLISRPAVLAFHDIGIGTQRHNVNGELVPSTSIFWDKIRKDERFDGYDAKVANKEGRCGIGLLWLEKAKELK